MNRENPADEVRIGGTGLTRFGEYPERPAWDLFAEAGTAALDEAGVAPGDVDELYYGNFIGALVEEQGHQGPLVAESLGIDTPATRFESACASSGVALRYAIKDVRRGDVDVAVVGGAERMTPADITETTKMLATAADSFYEIRQGMTFPGAYAIIANAYFDAYGGSRRDLAHVAVKNHANAVGNEYAQFQSEITIDDYFDAPLVASPLGLYDSCPITDGASALVLVSGSFADAHDIDAPTAITGTGQGSDRLALQDRDALAHTKATADAAQEAYSDAGITTDQVDAVEVHDCFSIAEVLAIEALGFVESGAGVSAAREGLTRRDGALPVNLSGGLKAKGHPVGASGTSQVVEMARLLSGEHHNSDSVDDVQIGVTHSAGGTVASTTVHVLERAI
jgi:acetyl-CoA C-acetyltransferase/acetyl-CoA acyltransferase